MFGSCGSALRLLLADPGAATSDGPVPVVFQIEPVRPRPAESWAGFKARVADRLGHRADLLRDRIGVGAARKLYAGNSLALELTISQLAEVAADPRITITFAELDQVLPVACGDDTLADAGGPAFRAAGGGLSGAGVRVAVLDTGIDLLHPALAVTHSVQTAGESVDVPGRHGTHCAGVIASTDPTCPGVAPGVTLINVKVLRADGSGRHTGIVAGIDRALDLSADILSISLGFNHLPIEAPGGHGWICADGRCPLCTAVDNAVLEGALVVAAAGNEHRRSALARAGGWAGATEISCPGQARRAVTVGAVHPESGGPAAFSSRGPTAFGLAKPDLAAPGVDVRSTVPRRPPVDTRSAPFAAMSGTSMAASGVAGTCALLIEAARRTGAPDDAETIRRRLLADRVEPGGWPAEAVGAGTLRLNRHELRAGPAPAVPPG